MAMRGINDHQVTFRRNQRLGALKTGIAHSRGGSHAQAARCILGRIGIGHRFFHVFHGNQAHAVEGIIHDQQFLNPAGMEQAQHLVLPNACLHSRQIFMRHQF